jgi:hypothetical protein
MLASLLAQQPASQSSAPPSLNYEFFRDKVQPVFLAKRTGRARCVSCHGGSQAQILVLQPLSPGANSWNEEQSRKNFEATKLVAIPGSLQSPLLTHPLAEEAGGDFFHSGGKQFNSQNDPEWQTLKAWIMGQKSSSGN